MKKIIKSKIFEQLYTKEYSLGQMEKHKNRHNNHWKNHIYWAKKMVKKFWGKETGNLLDLGCSIGTYAIEFALNGYKTIGLDLDPKALDLARQLASEQNLEPKWICANAGDFHLPDSVDIVLCFDLLEHLDDQTIMGMFKCIKENLNPDGIFVYHTFPTEYNHIFYHNLFFKQLTSMISFPLIPFRNLNDLYFTKIVKYYSNFLDLFSMLITGKNHKSMIRNTIHPNPLSQERLNKFLHNAGFDIIYSGQGIEDFNPLKDGQGSIAIKYFSNKTVAKRSLWGCAKIKEV
tara:strand:- start:3667 stop:4533 length:867 start_codon:yes stop_codon:yes gene_type:complete